MRKRWTQQDIELLKSQHRTSTNMQLANLLRTTVSSVEAKVCRLGIGTKRRNAYSGSREWEAWESDYIRSNVSQIAASEMGIHLNRTAGAVRHMVNRLGLKGHQRKRSNNTPMRRRDYNKWSWQKVLLFRNTARKCAICGYDKHVDIHHIEPVYSGGTDELENLIPLCPNHHREADAGEIDKTTLINYRKG